MTRSLQRLTRWLLVCTVMLAAVAAAQAIAPAPASRLTVARISLDDAIGPAAAEYFHDAATRAVADGSAAIVLQLDTPGGLSGSMRRIIADMLASPLPVLVYVAPGGARAASAGTYILYAGQIAAMAPGTHLGAATPVALGGGTPMPLPTAAPAASGSAASPAPPGGRTDAEANKVLNDAIAYIRSLAQLRGRNARWAEQAVRGAATLTADEAAQQGVIDFVAGDVRELLGKADGRVVRVGERELTLHLRGATVRDYAPDARSRFLAVVTNPTIAYLLLLAGIFGLLLEATHPGAILPGVVGGICLLVAFYALQWLPVNYAGLALMALGIGLLVAEALTPTVGALGVGGIISFVLGSIMLMHSGTPGYAVNIGVIAGIATAAALLIALVLWLVFKSRRSHLVSGDELFRGAQGELLAPLDADAEGWALVLGERWRVRAATPLPTGARVRVLRRQGLLLWVEPI
ncbi:NfeD family protein [Dyella sp. KRB-257]|uniref:NfeD family protein n=1 Tax=Dyella sp. KRB-257 TaxID=3400915 RepID=UPI003BFFE1F3